MTKSGVQFETVKDAMVVQAGGNIIGDIVAGDKTVINNIIRAPKICHRPGSGRSGAD